MPRGTPTKQRVHVVALDGGEVLERRDAEVEVDAVSLARQIPRVGAVLDIGFLARTGSAIGGLR